MKRATDRKNDAWLSHTPYPENPSVGRGRIRHRIPTMDEQENGETVLEVEPLLMYRDRYPC